MAGMSTPEDFVVPPVSDREKLLRKLDHRDKVMRAFETFILIVVVGITVFSLVRLNQIAESNQKATKVLLCTTSIPSDVKTQAEVDKCYGNGVK